MPNKTGRDKMVATNAFSLQKIQKEKDVEEVPGHRDQTQRLMADFIRLMLIRLMLSYNLTIGGVWAKLFPQSLGIQSPGDCLLL